LPPRACLRKDGAEMSAGGVMCDPQRISGLHAEVMLTTV
jgi:hypothetical protein